MSELNQDFNLENTKETQQLSIPQQADGEFDTARFYHAFNKSWKWIILLLVTFFILAFFYNRYTKPVFKASAIIQLEFNTDVDLVGLGGSFGDRNQKSKSLSGEIEIIKSKVLYQEIVKEVNLDVSYFFEGNLLNDEKFGSEVPFIITYNSEQRNVLIGHKVHVTIQENNELVISYGKDENRIEIETKFDTPISLKGFVFSVKKTRNTEENIGSPYFFILNSRNSLLSYLDKNVSVEVLNYEANTLNIHFSDYNQKKAKRITESVISNYLKKSVDQKQKSNAQTLKYINDQLDTTLSKLEDIESKMQLLSRGSMFGNTSESYNLISEQVDKYSLEKLNLSRKLELLNHLNKLITSNEDIDSFIPELDGLGTSSLTSSITHLNAINQEFQKLKESHKPSTLSYKNKEIERNATRKTIIGYIYENKKIIRSNLRKNNQKLAELQNEFKKLPSKETDLVGLKRYYGLYENYFLLLNQKKVEFETAKAGKVPDFLILAHPEVEGKPTTPAPSIIYIVFGVLALLLSVLLLVLFFFLQNKILNQKGLERVSDVPVIGSIPKFKQEKMHHSKLQVIDFPKSRVSEAFRNIRSNLEFFSHSKSIRVITTSSTISGEGKTFITLNLAGIIALSGKKVVVLDLDMRKPKLHLGFDTTNNVGMSDLLINKNTVEECIKHSDFEGLDFITAGTKPPNPSELILSKRFDSLLEELKERYDTIIIDTPPIGLVTDGISAMKKADIQLYVARAGYTKISMLKDIELIRRNKQFKNLSIILNDVSKGRSYGYSGYGYGYGYYEEDKVTND